jgi:hypothetical protein
MPVVAAILTGNVPCRASTKGTGYGWYARLTTDHYCTDVRGLILAAEPMQLYYYLLAPILGVATFLAMAGCTVCRKKKLLDDERRQRSLENLRAALGD